VLGRGFKGGFTLKEVGQVRCHSHANISQHVQYTSWQTASCTVDPPRKPIPEYLTVTALPQAAYPVLSPSLPISLEYLLYLSKTTKTKRICIPISQPEDEDNIQSIKPAI
jgi:hypothetical protein